MAKIILSGTDPLGDFTSDIFTIFGPDVYDWCGAPVTIENMCVSYTSVELPDGETDEFARPFRLDHRSFLRLCRAGFFSK